MTFTINVSDLLTWLIVGLIAGFLANSIMHGRSGGILNNLLVGVIGALLGGVLAQLLDIVVRSTGLTILYSIAVAVVGALILLALTGRPFHFSRFFGRR